MNNDTNFFSGRYWLPASIVSVLLFLGVSVYFAFALVERTQQVGLADARLNELKVRISGINDLSEQIVVGDSSAIDSLVNTMSGIDITQAALQANVDSLQLPATSSESLISAIDGLKNNVAVLSSLSPSLSLLSTQASQLQSAADETQNILAGTAEKLTRKGNSPQLPGIHSHALLVREMANELNAFLREPTPTSQPFDRYQELLVAFEANHQVLLEGDATANIVALNNDDVRADIQAANELLAPLKGSAAELSSAVQAMLLARTNQDQLAASVSRVNLAIDDSAFSVETVEATGFPQPIAIIFAVLALIISGAIVVASLRQPATIEVEQGSVDSDEGVQAAILRLLDELADLADGDLTVTTTVSEDFTGAIADSVNYTIDQLRQLVSRINRTAVQVSGAAQESQQTALHLAEASDHQAQEIAGASAAINEMAVTIDQVSANAAESALVASKSVSIANNGAKLVQNTIHGMDTIREQIQDTSKRIKRLGESSQEIGDIVSLINDIADQTNILALNAAIQASMAGDAGRGFAVVADEVQRLAERSAGATKQIESLVKTIQSDTNEAVVSMEQTTAEVVGGARLAQDAGVALEEIEGVSANIAELIQNISNAARQQALSAGHISNTMNVIQEITSQTSAGTSATAHSIGDLADMALELRESVAGFTLPDEMENEQLDGALTLDDSWLSADDSFDLADTSLLNEPASDMSQLFGGDEGFDLQGTSQTETNMIPDEDDLDISIDEEFDLMGDDFGSTEDDLSLLDTLPDEDALAEDLSDDDFDLSAFDFGEEKQDSVR